MERAEIRNRFQNVVDLSLTVQSDARNLDVEQSQSGWLLGSSGASLRSCLSIQAHGPQLIAALVR